MADDAVDTSDMPDPTTIGLKPPAPGGVDTGDMPTPAQLFKQHHGYDASSPEDVAEFMRNPGATPAVRNEKSGRYGASMLTGLPRAAAGYAAAVPAGVASIAGQASGALGAALDPYNASDYLAQGRDRGRAWAAKVNNLANYVPATAAGADAANALMAAPSDIFKGTVGAAAKAVLPDNAYQAVSDVTQDIGTDLPVFGALGAVRAGARAVGKAAGAAKGALTDIAPEGTTYNAAGTAVAPSQALTAPVDPPVTGDTLRAQPNPIPAPEGTIHSQVHPASLAPEAAGAAPKPSAPAPTFESPDATPAGAPTEQPAPPESPATQGSAENAPAQAPPPLAAAGETPPTGAATLPDTDSAPLDMSLSPDERALVREGVAARRAASDSQRGSAQLFSEPTKTGPQATPEPAQQSARAQSLDDIDKLSGGMLPSRRASAISGDYNATGDDYQLKEVGSEPMRQQLASENSAMHAAAENVHQSIGSQFNNSVDPQTVSDRGRVTRGAIQGIQDFFQKSTDESYDAARASSGDKPMPNFLGRVDSFLKDDANYMPEGFRRSAQARLQQLKTAGDNGIESGSAPAAPSSVAAAEKFREWLNSNRTLDNMHTVRQMVDHTDTDVAEHGGPGLFQTARDMRRHQYQMLEEPTGIKKLLAPADSQGINHAIPEHKVMDYIADLPREQHEHVLNVLRAGAHLGGGELANDSAGAIREIQAHMVSRMHDAATNADGTWNARKFYNQASSYAPKLGDTFRDQPKTRQNLQTINRAGNALSMDKHYPGAAAQAERTGLGTKALQGAGNVVASLAHDIPFAGRLVGRAIEGAVEGMSEKGREAARDKAAMSRLVDRTGKQRGSVQLFNDNDLNQGRDRDSFHGKFVERNPRTEYNANSQLAGGRQRLTAEQNDIIGRLGGGKQRGAVGDLSQRDAITHKSAEREDGTVSHLYGVPEKGGGLGATEYPDRGVTRVMTSNVNNKGQGWGTRMLQRAADDAHARGQVLHSDSQVSDGQAGAYSNLKKLGYDVTKKDADHSGGAYHAVGDHVFEVRPGSNEYRAPKELEDFIKKSAPAHRVDPNGPSNWEELQARRNEKVMPINPQGGEGSIYKDVPTNMAFRAWHDKTHLDVNGGFDHDGELATAREQLRQAKAAGLSDESQRALWADTWETFKHHEDNGEFPKNPRQFVAQRMQDKTPLGERVAASKQRGAVGDLGKKDAPARILDKTRDLAEDVGERMHGFDQDVMDKATEAHDYLRHLPKRIVNKARDIGEDVGERLHGFDQDVMDKATEAHDYLRHLPKRIADKARDIGENVGERFIGADQDMMDKATELRDRAERMVGIRERNPRSKQRGSASSGSSISGDDVVKHIQKNGLENERSARELLGKDAKGAYQKVELPLDEVDADTPISSGIVERYAKRDTPFPAIVTDSSGKVVDGNHRVAAARVRGDKTISAYVPQRGSVRVINPKPVLEDSREIADHIQDTSPSFVDHERIEEEYRGTHAVLRQLPVDSLKEGDENGNVKSSAKQARYNKKDPKEAPPIVTENGTVVDGNHRLRAAKANGEKTISAYDIREGEPPNRQRGSVKVMNDKPSEEKGGGSMLNIGLHQGQEGEKGFRKMSKQEAAGAVESTGAKVTRSSVLTPDTHGVAEPTLVASTDRALSNPEMQKVLAKTKQSAIPQRTDAGETSMHVAPGHEEIAKREGWDTFNPDYFREHNGQSMSEAGEGPPAKRYPASPDATVKNPTQSKFPGIYDDPKEIMNRLGAGAPESPHMKDIFGVTRKDLHDATLARGDVEPKTPIPGITPKGKGSMHALRVMTPENAERIRSTIQAYKEHDPSGYHGMVGWYEMDPMFKSIKKILGGDADRAGDVYHKLNSYTSYASPMSSVDPEIRRGTAAATMAAEGNFGKFEKHGGKPNDKAPSVLKSKNFELGNEGHAMHSTAHAGAMTRFNEYGEEARAVKTGTYRRSSDAPSRLGSEHQNTVPVGDSHWSRGVGLADVRGAAAFEGSAEGPEMKVLAPWYHDQIARHHDIDLPSTSAQAVQWGALSKETGVDSPVGAPKLEIWANQIASAAERAGIKPKEMWQRIVKRLAK